MASLMASAASYPPSQKARGQGTHSFKMGKKQREGRGTRHSAKELGGPFTTYSFNAGGGPLKGLSLQLAYSGGIWQFSIGLPIPYTGISTPSAGFDKLTTTTKPTTSGCN